MIKPPEKKVDESKSLERKSLNKRDPAPPRATFSQKVKEKRGYVSANRRLILILGAVICLVIALALYTGSETGNQTNNQTNNSQANATFNIYDDQNITFNYPLNWNISQEEVDPPLIVTVMQDENNLLSVFSEDLGNRTLKDKLVEWKENLIQTSNVTYDQATTVDNTSAYDVQTSTTTDSVTYITRGVAFEKNNRIYYLIFVFNSSILDYKEDMELILNSFHVKESS